MGRRDIDPFVVLPELERANWADDRGGVGSDADELGLPLDPVDGFERVCRRDLDDGRRAS